MGRAKPVAFVLFFAAAWIVTEWLRGTMFTGFAWNPLAAVFVDLPVVRDVSRNIGTYGLSAWVVGISGLLAVRVRPWFEQLKLHRGDGTWPTYVIGPPLIAVVLIFLVASMASRPRFYPQPQERPLIRIVQPNIGQQDKYEPGYDIDQLHQAREDLTGKPGLVPPPDPSGQRPPSLTILRLRAMVEADDARACIAKLLGPNDVLMTGGSSGI